MHHMNDPMMTGPVAALYGIAIGFVIGAHLIRYGLTKDSTELSHAIDHILMAGVMLLLTGHAVAVGRWALAGWAIWLAIHMFGQIKGRLRKA